MTNLISSASRQWFTRGRVLVGIPVAIGLFAGALLSAFVIRPLGQDVQKLEERRDDLLQLQRNLPVLEVKLKKAASELEQAQQQQAALIGLLAGRDKVQTFLALLNQQALLAGVNIQRYEPIQPPAPSPTSQKKTTNSRSGASEEPVEPVDPLLALGYQKSSVAFAVRGSFSGLQEFLKRMESLELLVESSELEIRAERSGQSDQDADPVESRTLLTLKLSFYDMNAEASS